MVIVDFASACICVSLCMYHYCGYATVGFMVRQSFFFNISLKINLQLFFSVMSIFKILSYLVVISISLELIN